MGAQRILILILFSTAVAQLGACSVYKASVAPPEKDLGVLNPGTPRSRVTQELGSPIETEPVEGGRKDCFTFIQGYARGPKVAGTIFLGLADLYTLGLGEVERDRQNRFLGKKMSIGVVYDSNDRVTGSEMLSITDP